MLRNGLPAPTAIYFNSGLHLLHMIPASEWYTANCAEHWISFEDDLESVVNMYTETAPNATIALMTTHEICEEKFFGNYAHIRDLCHDDSYEAAKQCIERMPESSDLPKENVTQLCQDAFATRKGSHFLYDRTIAAVKRFIYAIRVVDAFQITSGNCDLSSDGRHYNLMVAQELRALFAQIFQ